LFIHVFDFIRGKLQIFYKLIFACLNFTRGETAWKMCNWNLIKTSKC
jgi:hypothetical protein